MENGKKILKSISEILIPCLIGSAIGLAVYIHWFKDADEEMLEEVFKLGETKGFLSGYKAAKNLYSVFMEQTVWYEIDPYCDPRFDVSEDLVLPEDGLVTCNEFLSILQLRAELGFSMSDLSLQSCGDTRSLKSRQSVQSL